MKVAILISGQPRNYKRGYNELHDSYLSQYDCDVYFHTWDDTRFEASKFFDRSSRIYTVDEHWKNDLLFLYSPVSYQFETPIRFADPKLEDPIWKQGLNNSMSMWHSIKQSFTGIPDDYDLYIRTRFDLRYDPSLLDLETLDRSSMHLWDWDTDSRVKNRGLNDLFAIGTYEQMKAYVSLFDSLTHYLYNDQDYRRFLQGGWPGQDSGLRNEYLLKWHLFKNKVPVTSHPNQLPSSGQIIR